MHSFLKVLIMPFLLMVKEAVWCLDIPHGRRLWAKLLQAPWSMSYNLL